MKQRIFRSSAALWVNSFTIGLMYFSISSLSTLIGKDLGFSDAQLSILFSLPTFAYIVTGWLPGSVVDRLGKRKSIVLVFILLWIPAFLKLTTANYAVFVVLTVIQSAGILLSAPSNSKTVKELDIPNFAKVLGLVNTGMTIGTWCTHTFALKLAGSTGSWKGATLIFLAVTLLLGTIALFLLLTLRETKQEKPAEMPESQTKPGKKQGLFSGTKEQNLVLIGIAVLYFGTLATSFALNNWLPKLLTYGGFSASDSALSASMFALGSLLSTVAIPFLFPNSLRKSAFSIPSSVFTIGLLVLLLFLKAPAAALAAALLLGVLSGFLQIMVQYQIVENCSSKLAGQYSSFVFFVGNTGATISILGVGMIPETMFAGKILFISLFSLVSVAGGLILLSQAKKLRQQKKNTI